MSSNVVEHDTQSKLDELVAKEESRGVIARFVRAADRFDRDMMVSCYHDDALDVHGSDQVRGVDLFDEVTSKFVCRMMHHNISYPYVRVDGDKAWAETYCIATWVRGGEFGEEPSTACVRYVDSFEKRKGEWRIAHRVGIVDWMSGGERGPDQPPLNPESVGHRSKQDYTYQIALD